MTKITTTGIGTVKTKADTINMNICVCGINYDYDKALSEAASALNEVKLSLQKAGFAEGSLKTARFDVSKRTESVQEENGEYKNKFVGYECRYDNTLTFAVDMQKLSDCISLLSTCSAFPDFDIRFSVSEVEAIKKELLKSAFEDAKRSAEILCEAAGLSLKEASDIRYASTSIRPFSDTACNMPRGRMLFAAEAIDITPEDIENSESVTVEWEVL